MIFHKNLLEFDFGKVKGLLMADKRRTAEIVLEKIVEHFLKKQLKAGEKLPSERELATRFGVSRNSVREALQILALKNVIEIRRGGGSYVIQSDTNLIHEALSEKVTALESHLVFEMLEVRRALEVEAAALAAQRASAKDLNNIREALEMMAVSINEVESGTKADLQFHMCIVAASHNSILIHLAETLINQMKKTIQTTRQHRFSDPGRYEETFNEHREIYLAIASGNSSLAKSLMELHISRVRSELSESMLPKLEM